MPKIVKLNRAKRNVLAFRMTDEENEVIETIARELRMPKGQVIHFLIKEALEQIHGVHFGGEKNENIE